MGSRQALTCEMIEMPFRGPIETPSHSSLYCSTTDKPIERIVQGITQYT